MKTKLSLAIIIPLLFLCLNTRSSVFAKTFLENTQVSFTSVYNDAFTKNVLSSALTIDERREYEISSISLSLKKLQNNTAEGVLKLFLSDEKISVFVSGTVEYFPSSSGFIAILDGIGNIYGKEENITVDLLYINNLENFSAISIGCMDEKAPQLLFFGERTAALNSLSLDNINASIKKHASSSSDESKFKSKGEKSIMLDAITRFQDTYTNTSYGYEMATVSVYYANELTNQGVMGVYAKINSHTADVKSYLQNIQGYGSITVYPDTYILKIISANQYLHSTHLVSPVTGATTQNVSFPAYLPVIGFFTFDYSLTMTSTSVNYSAMSGGSIYSNNIVQWEVFKHYGWSESDMDGYYNDNRGGKVYSQYTFAGNNTISVNADLGASGQIRYEFVSITAMQVLHHWTYPAICANHVVVFP